MINKLPDTLSSSQKERKVLTLLMALKRKGIITTDSDNLMDNWKNCLITYITSLDDSVSLEDAGEKIHEELLRIKEEFHEKIRKQKKYLESYAGQRGYTNCRHYTEMKISYLIQSPCTENREKGRNKGFRHNRVYGCLYLFSGKE